MTTETDGQGRLYLPSDIRDRHGDEYHIVEYQDRIELIPVDEDPLRAVRDEIGGVLNTVALEEVEERCIERGRREVRDDHRGAPDPNDTDESTNR